MRDSNSNRGRIVEIKLKRAITLNGEKITKAVIEIDHVNFGFNQKTKTGDVKILV